LTRQFLHSYLLDFVHPKTGEELHFVDGLSLDLQTALDTLASRSLGVTAAGEEVFASLGITDANAL
ncbi:MAG: hypothetical protein RR825_08835, partial [Ruthenibacterium sp.]